MTDMAPIPAGSLLTISTGCYSDYTVHGVFRAKVDIDAAALRDRWLELHPEQVERHMFEERDFLGWLATEGTVESVDSFEWHLEDYSDVSEMSVSHEGSEGAETA